MSESKPVNSTVEDYMQVLGLDVERAFKGLDQAQTAIKAPVPTAQHVCPNCGYCPTCGRPRLPYFPYYPYYPQYPYYYWMQNIQNTPKYFGNTNTIMC